LEGALTSGSSKQRDIQRIALTRIT